MEGCRKDYRPLSRRGKLVLQRERERERESEAEEMDDARDSAGLLASFSLLPFRGEGLGFWSPQLIEC